MAIPVHHTLKLEEVNQIPYNPEIYRNIGVPPRFHIFCTCQWEGWTHQREQAVRWIMSHKQAQEMRGNTVSVEGVNTEPVAEAAGDAQVFAQVEKVEPTEGVESTQKLQFHPEQNLDGTKKQVGQ